MKQNEYDVMKEIHAIRAANYEQTKDLSPEERSRLRTEAALPVIEKWGFKLASKHRREEFYHYG